MHKSLESLFIMHSYLSGLVSPIFWDDGWILPLIHFSLYGFVKEVVDSCGLAFDTAGGVKLLITADGVLCAAASAGEYSAVYKI